MTDALTWGIAASFAAQEGIRFLYGQLTELLKRARDKKAKDDPVVGAPDIHTGTQADDVLVSKPPVLAFDQAPDQLRLPVEGLVGHEVVLEKLLEEIREYLDNKAAGKVPDKAALNAISDLRALSESLSGQRLTFVGEPKRDRPIVRIKAAIERINGRFVGVQIRSGTHKDFHVDVHVGDIGPEGDTTIYKEQ